MYWKEMTTCSRFLFQCLLSAKSCPALCDPKGCTLPSSSVHGIYQARILERAAISYSGDLPNPRNKPAFLESLALVDWFFTLSHLACSPMFTAALFSIPILWKQLKCPSIDEWIKKMWFLVYMYVCVSVYYNGILLSHLKIMKVCQFRQQWTRSVLC